MRKLTKFEALRIIIECAKIYERDLLNNYFIFIYRTGGGSYDYVEVLFKPKHFMHLTGNEKMVGVSSINFFNKCIDNTLSVEDIKLTNEMNLKLEVLPKLMQIHKSAKMIGPYNGSKVALYTEKVIGTVKGCMGFVYDENDLVLVPNTVLQEDTRLVTNGISQVVAVYSKRFDSELYDTICYVAANSDIGKKSPQSLVWPTEIQGKIVPSGIQSLC